MKKIFVYIVILILLIIPVVNLFNPGLPVTHDGRDHVARIANFYQSLSEGNIVPRWAGNLNWGYGHPILMFLYPLPSYTASLFHFLGFSLVFSTKIIFALGMVLSGIFMYLWLSSFLNRTSSLFGAVLYIYAPYRFVDVYVRGAIGENFAFIWPPLILYSIYKAFKTKSVFYYILFSFSLAFLILSHNAISLMFIPFIIFYIVYLAFQKQQKIKFLILYSLFFILSFLLSAFFWLPALLEGKYTLREVVKGGFNERFVEIGNLIYSPWSYGISGQFSVMIGFIHLSVLLISPFILYNLYKKKTDIFYLAAGLFIYALFSIFIMLPQSAFIWNNFSLIQNFQFPWRFLTITVFSLSVLGGIVASALLNKNRKVIFAFLIVLTVFLSKEQWKGREYTVKPENYYSGVFESTTDTGESAPIWSVRFMEKRAKAPLEVIDGNARVKLLEKKSNRHLYLINAESRTLFGENTLYFPGWEIKVNGQKIPVQFQNQDYRGIMTFFLDKGEHKVEVVFGETKLRRFSNYLSLFAIVLVLILVYLRKYLNLK